MAMAASKKRSQPVDATITILELRGVKCHAERGHAITSGFSRLSATLGDYADVNDNSDGISSEPNIRAVISFQHHASSGSGDAKKVWEQHLPSLPMGEVYRDTNHNIVMSGAWPGDDKNNSIQFSRDIQRMEIEDEANTRTEMSIPASVSLRVGLIINGSDDILPLGVATVLISGKEQTLELSIPVEAGKKRQRISPKALFKHVKNPSMYSFHISGFTILKIKLAVTARPYDPTLHRAHRPTASFEAFVSKKLPSKVFGKESKLKSRLYQVRDSTRYQVNSFKTKAVLALNARRARSSVRVIDEDDPESRFLPELTVLPPSGFNSTQYHDGATEIVLNSSTLDDPDVDASKLATVFANSTEVESSACSIITERNQEPVTKKGDCTSVNTQRTRSSSQKSSSEGFSEIVITASRVTFEELSVTSAPPTSPPRAASPAPEELFSKDVTTELDEIVKDYSMRANEDKVGSMNDVLSNETIKEEVEDSNVIQSATVSSEESSNRYIEQPQISRPMVELIVTSTDAATSSQAAVEDLRTSDKQPEMPNDGHVHSNDSRGITSVMLIHEDETGTVFTVEVSVDGENLPRSTPSQTHVETKNQGKIDNIDGSQSQFQKESSQVSHKKSATLVVTPIQDFEGGIISVNHTMSSIGELTVDSALDTITIPSAISKSLKVARNRRHPQRTEAANFLRQITICGRKYDIAELMDDAVVGWRDIVVGDELCDGMDDFECEGFENDSDDGSATISLNTMDERKPSILSEILCRERKIAKCASQDEST
ncbi:hypothetical protein ACHAWX_001267 [Stephanocyclus meneghinianus]